MIKVSLFTIAMAENRSEEKTNKQQKYGKHDFQQIKE